MNLKTTYILFGVLAAALGAFLLTQLFHWGKPGNKSDYLFPEFNKKKDAVEANVIDKIEITHGDSGKDSTFVFEKDGKGWEMKSPGRFRIEDQAVSMFVSDLTRAATEKSEVGNDLHEYALDSPRIKVVLSGGGKDWKLNVGRESPGIDPEVFVTTGDQPKQPKVVKKSAISSIFKTLGEFRSKELLAASQDSIQTIKLQAGSKGETVVLEKGSDGRWAFKKPADFGAADYEGSGPPPIMNQPEKEITGVLGILQAINSASLRVMGDKDFVADNVSTEDLKDKYGLAKDSPETLRIEITSTKGKGDDATKTTEVLLIGKKVPEEKEDKKDEKKDEAKDKKKDEDKKKPDPNKTEFYYARLENESSVVKVPLNKVKHLVEVAKKPDAIRDRNLAHFQRDKVDAIRIEYANVRIKLYHTDALDPWKLWKDKDEKNSGSGRNADDEVVRKLLNSFDDKAGGKGRVDSFPTKDDLKKAGMGEKDRPAVVSIWVDGLKKQGKEGAEPKLKDPKKPTVKLTFGNQDKEKGLIYVLREVDGDKEPTLLLVKNKEAGGTLADHVTAGPLAYLDRKIPTFSGLGFPDVARLTIVRGGEKYELKQDKTGNKQTWTFEAPKDLSGRQGDVRAIMDLQFVLQRLSALRIAAEKPDDKQLEQFGLKPPKIEVTVVLKSKDDKDKDDKDKKDKDKKEKDAKEEKYVFSFGNVTEDRSGYYAKTAKSDLVYVVPKDAITPLEADLLDKTIFAFDVDKVRRMKLTGWKGLGIQVTLDLERKSKQSWQAKTPKDFELEPATAEAFLNMLANLRAMKFLKTGPKPEHGLEAKNKDLMVIEIDLDGEKQPLKLTIGKLDAAEKGYFAMSSKFKDQVFLLPEDDFKRMLEKPGYFLQVGK